MKSVDSHARSAYLLWLRAYDRLHPLPRPGLHGRRYARAFDSGLREIVCPHWGPFEKFDGQEAFWGSRIVQIQGVRIAVAGAASA